MGRGLRGHRHGGGGAVSAAEDRRSLGAAAVVRPTVAAEWLPMADDDALEWMRNRGLIRTMSVPDRRGGGVRTIEVVVWAEVLDEIMGRRVVPAPAKRKVGRLPYVDPEE